MTQAAELRDVYLVRTSDGQLLHCEPQHFGDTGEWWSYRWSIADPSGMVHVGPPVSKTCMTPGAIRVLIDEWWQSTKGMTS